MAAGTASEAEAAHVTAVSTLTPLSVLTPDKTHAVSVSASSTLSRSLIL